MSMKILKYSRFICSSTKVVGALTDKIPMTPKVASLHTIWEISEDLQRFSNTLRKIVKLYKTQTVKLVGRRVQKVLTATNAIQLLRDSTIQTNIKEYTVIEVVATSQKSVLFTTLNKSVIMLKKWRKIIERKLQGKNIILTLRWLIRLCMIIIIHHQRL